MPRSSTNSSGGVYSINPVGEPGRSGLRASRGEYLSRTNVQHEVTVPSRKGAEPRRYRAWNPSETQCTKKDGGELVISAPKINSSSPALVLKSHPAGLQPLRDAHRARPVAAHAAPKPPSRVSIRPERLGRAREGLGSHPPTLADKIFIDQRRERRTRVTPRPSFDRLSITAVACEPDSVDFVWARGLIREGASELVSFPRWPSPEPVLDTEPAAGPTEAQRKRYGWIASQEEARAISFPDTEGHSDEEDEGKGGADEAGSGASRPAGGVVAVEHRSATPSQPSVVVTAPSAATADARAGVDRRRLSVVDAYRAVAEEAEGRYRKLVRMAAPLVDAFDRLRAYDEFAQLRDYQGAAEIVAGLLEERGQLQRARAEMDARDNLIWRLENENRALRRQAELPVRLY